MILVDLDGTLVDARRRMYQVFKGIVRNTSLSSATYWDMKRNGIGHEQILLDASPHESCTFKAFQELWLRRIESPENLALDEEQPGASCFLASLAKSNDLILFTARRNCDLTAWELRRFGWDRFFERIVTVGGEAMAKTTAVRQFRDERVDLLVGDTCDDVQAARVLGVPSGVVANGFTSRERLAACAPTYLCTDLLSLLTKIGK